MWSPSHHSRHCQKMDNLYNSKEVHLPNHLMLGSTLATVPGATVDWYCKGLITFPRLLLETQDQSQCEQSTYCYISLPLTTSANQQLTGIMQIFIINYHLCFCLYIFRRLIVARSLMLFPPAPWDRSEKYMYSQFNVSSVQKQTNTCYHNTHTCRLIRYTQLLSTQSNTTALQ